MVDEIKCTGLESERILLDTHQKEMLDAGIDAERFTLGVFEDYVNAELVYLAKLLGNKFYSGYSNDVFQMHEDWSVCEPECTCGYVTRLKAWQANHHHSKTCCSWNETVDVCDCELDQQFSEWLQAEGRGHDRNCLQTLPCFRYGEGDKEIAFHWYKHIGRSMTVNRRVTMLELRSMFAACDESLV